MDSHTYPQHFHKVKNRSRTSIAACDGHHEDEKKSRLEWRLSLQTSEVITGLPDPDGTRELPG
jgi:hypothetical protein